VSGRRWAWRGEDEDRGRPPRRVGEGLGEATAALGLSDLAVLGDLVSAWEDTVGGAVAAHAQPRRLRDRVLVVEVDTPEWATQLRFLEARLVERVASVAGPGKVTAFEFVVRRR